MVLSITERTFPSGTKCEDLIQYFPSPSVFTDAMNKSAPNKRQPGYIDLRTIEAFRQETPRLRAWLRRNAAAWQSVDDLLQDLFAGTARANWAGAGAVEGNWGPYRGSVWFPVERSTGKTP